ESYALLLDGAYLQYSNLKELSFGLPREQSASIEFELNIKDLKHVAGTIRFEIRNKALPGQKEYKGPVVNRFSWKRNTKYHSIIFREGNYHWPKSIKIDTKLPKGLKSISSPRVEFEHFLPKHIIQTFEVTKGKDKKEYVTKSPQRGQPLKKEF
ncbi:MAG: hypothetical protein HGA46_11530, partial [Chlorobiaceae bacterium]|nr:hypothetical protein [Chlorobiaceae bacterium]